MAMRRATTLLLAAGLVLEFALALFPPMRITLAAKAGEFLVGRTEHLSIFSRLGGAWTIDSGRLLAEVFLIAVGTLLAITIESWLHQGRSTATSPGQTHPSRFLAAVKKIARFLASP
jgi:hypothetical protein